MLRIGLDIGGTFIKGGLLDHEMHILAEETIAFPGAKRLDVLPGVLEDLAVSLCRQAGKSLEVVQAIGVGVPGSLDPAAEQVLDAHNLGMTDYPLLALLQDQFPLQQVRLINDANAAALAEHRLGALRGCRTGLMITLGTGVGGGLILDGELFNGGMGQGVELGHMRLVHQGEACSCGNRGCVEAYCSSAYFLRTGMEPLQRVELARSGDPESMAIVDRYLDYLSDALVSMIVLLDPEIIALGGGISKAGEFLFGPLRQLVDQKTFFRICPRIEGALLGNKAGFIGAALLDWD